jgi:hypothetical protein
MAIDVRASAASGDDKIHIPPRTIMLGNVLPGEFSVIVDAMIMSECEGFFGLLNLEWGEIGDLSRKDAIFEFEVISQAGVT